MMRPLSVTLCDSRGGSRRRSAVTAVVWLLVAMLECTGPAYSARVLAIESVAAKSHWNFMKGVLDALVARGHRVTAYTPFPDGLATADGYAEVDTSAEYPDDTFNVFNMNATVVVPLFSRPSFLVPFMANASRLACDLTDKLLANVEPDAFDLFVTEPLSSNCLSYAASRLGLPLVYTVPAPLLPWIEAFAFGHYANPAYAPHLLSPYAVPNTFYRRVHNAALHLYTVFEHYSTAFALSVADSRHYDRLPPVAPSLVFVNTHYVTEPSRPTPVNRVDVGGIHVKTPKPLPANILKFIEDSSNGVIIFTFGSVVTISTLPDNIQNAFIDALAEVPQRVLLKYEGELKNKPKNVMTSKWLPQRDILLHPKVKLFISHGGISGVYEAVDAGVPVLGFPLFYDQPRNIENLVDAGMAISMDLMSVTKDTFLNAINDIVNNETYSKNAKIVSERFKDRPMSPADSVVYWTEYVIRHKGAPHLMSNAQNLTWYQYFLLDVIAVALLGAFIVSYITYKGLKCIKKNLFNTSSRLKSKHE